ncbi:reprolysin-like metallopeptidase [Chryseobacterium sp. CT-SW4]|uniref:reprolysin-like metallopeptidase n=1 Tax=Chryseobacterium sp. SW-1 TaxID=3157343 RepID=UPI003B01A84F
MKIIFTLLLLCPFLGYSQWARAELHSRNVKKSQEKLEFRALYTLDTNQLKQTLKKAPSASSNTKGVVVTIPGADGKLERFQVWEFSNMAPELQEKYPDIRSYVGKGVGNSKSYLRFSLSPVGFSSMVTKPEGSEFIEAYTEDRTLYAVSDSRSRKNREPELFECLTETQKNSVAKSTASTTAKKAAGFNVFRLALSCTGEYAQYHLSAAGTPSTATDAQKKAVVLAAMNATLTRLNSVFEKDLSLHFNLIANNDAIIFLNPASDPYSTSAGPYQAQTGITSVIPVQNFDMGHLLDKKNANGAAGAIGVLCKNNSKAQGWTAHNFPEGDKFDIDYVAHEMGHQLGANHTFSYVNASETSQSLVEPGSGNTIMAYTGIMGGNVDVQFNSYDYFHTYNITEIKNYLNTVSCGVNTPFTIAAPSIDAGADYTIPKSTPFVLKGTTNDINSSAYTYSWEQLDSGVSQTGGVNSLAYPAKPSGPTFKSLLPKTEPVRYFPDFNKVLAGVLSTRWESVSSVGRNLNFTLTVRTNHPTQPQTNKDETVVTVNAGSGPFKVTAPAFGQSWSSGGTFNVTWDVANTNQAPISTSLVNIKLSTDGGQTFTTLVAGTPNDGSEQVVIPAGSTASNAYILVEAVGNIYYAVSSSFVIDYNVTGENCAVYTYSGPSVNITDGPGGTAISSPRVEVPLVVNNTGVITKIKVTPTISHSNIGDLAVGIESPAGSSALLWSRTCNNSSGINAIFSDTGSNYGCASPVQGEVKPDESLSIFKGHSAQGEWKLFASDNYPQNEGSITSWSLEVCTRETQALGLNETPGQYLEDDLKIYPNPSDGNFFIKSRNFPGEIKVVIYDASGRLVHSSSYQQDGGENTQAFNLQVTKGVYLININTPKGVYNKKMIIK